MKEQSRAKAVLELVIDVSFTSTIYLLVTFGSYIFLSRGTIPLLAEPIINHFSIQLLLALFGFNSVGKILTKNGIRRKNPLTNRVFCTIRRYSFLVSSAIIITVSDLVTMRYLPSLAEKAGKGERDLAWIFSESIPVGLSGIIDWFMMISIPIYSTFVLASPLLTKSGFSFHELLEKRPAQPDGCHNSGSSAASIVTP